MKFGEIWKRVLGVCVSGKWKSDDSGLVYSQNSTVVNYRWVPAAINCCWFTEWQLKAIFYFVS